MSFDLTQFARDPRLVLACIPAEEIFGLMTRSVELPAEVACCLRDASGLGRWITTGRLERGTAEELWFVRLLPMGLLFSFSGLSTKSGHLADVGLQVRVRVDRRPGGLEAMSHRLGGREVTRSHLQESLRSAVRDTVQPLFARHTMPELLSPAGEWTRQLRQDLVAYAFALGLAVEGVEVLSLHSPGYEQELRERERNQLDTERLRHRQKLAAAVAEQRVGELSAVEGALAKLRELSAANPEIGMAQLLQQFSGEVRARLYSALLSETEPALAAQVLVLTGKNVLRFGQGEEEPEMIVLPGDLGAFRSMSPASDGWLIGARRGVWQVDAAFCPRQVCRVKSDIATQGGFNGAVLSAGRLIATHSELGVLAWSLPEGKETLLFPPDGERIHSPVAFSDGRVAWAVGTQIWIVERGQATRRLTTLSSPCQVLVGEQDRLLAGLENGQVVQIDPFGDGSHTTLIASLGRAIRGLHVVHLAGLPWVLIADGGSRVQARVLGDTFFAEYVGRHAIASVVGHSLLIAGVDSLRARVLVWAASRPEEPLWTLEVKQRFGSSVQDVAVR